MKRDRHAGPPDVYYEKGAPRPVVNRSDRRAAAKQLRERQKMREFEVARGYRAPDGSTWGDFGRARGFVRPTPDGLLERAKKAFPRAAPPQDDAPTPLPGEADRAAHEALLARTAGGDPPSAPAESPPETRRPA